MNHISIFIMAAISPIAGWMMSILFYIEEKLATEKPFSSSDLVSIGG